MFGRRTAVRGVPWKRSTRAGRRSALALATTLGLLAGAKQAEAQQKTFYLDRLTIGGAPDDGIAVWRPVMHDRTRFFGQMALGFSLHPLRAGTIAPDASRAQKLGDPVSSQLIDYATVGTQISNRVAFLATLPVAFYQSGNDPRSQGVGNGIDLQAVAAGDLQLQTRVRLLSNDARTFHWGVGGSYFVPIGNQFSYGGDPTGHGMVDTAVELDIRQLIVAVDAGVHMRPASALGALGIGDELVLKGGAFYLLRDGKVRIGGEVFGSTGIADVKSQTQSQAQKSFFTGKNTPFEWMAEGRFALDEKQHGWAGVGAGSRIDTGYGAPDFRIVATIGYWYSIVDSDATSPAARLKLARQRRGPVGDADHDGIPDDVDLCPSVPEDKQEPDPTDGCPKPPDRDGDGIPDEYDKCPDQPEDKDGIDDGDGCPEDDYDKDGVPDAQDACPREPGQPAPEPKQNGCPQFIKHVEGSTEIQILKRIEFDTGKATIKPVSFPILDEVVKLLKANPDIKRVSIEGHTDDRGAVAMNNKLSQDRADSVMKYLSEHGVAGDRLEAHGFGPSRPLESNATEAGRQKNRRVEFHIVQGDAPKPAAGK